MLTVKWMPVAFLLVLLVGATLALVACSSGVSGQDLALGSQAPDFRLKDLSGQSVSLSSLRGDVVILNYWQVNCQPCQDEMPHLQAIYDAWKGRGVTLLALNAGEDTSAVKDFIESGNYTFPVLIDTNLKIAEKYNILYTPTTFILDKEGKLRYKIIGAFEDQTAIEKQFTGLLD
jgi:peroxiredoxin